MHKVTIPQAVIDRVMARRGKPYAFADLDPAKTALVVVDMQNAFMLPGVAHSPCASAPEIVPNINRIAASLRRTGGTVAWIRTRFIEATLTDWSAYWETVTPARKAKRIEALSPGGKGFELWGELEVEPEDLVVDKLRFSAFIQGSSDLEAKLRARGVDTVLVTGTVTNVCCESTARDAMMRNFRTVMVTDGNAAVTDEEHNASLTAFYLNFGDVMPTEMILGCIARNARASAAAE